MQRPEPKVEVRGEDVAEILKRRIRPGSLEAAEVRSAIAAQAGCSTETVKRIEDDKFDWVELDRADKLIVAAGGHLAECEIREA